jgi:hypothetical protein
MTAVLSLINIILLSVGAFIMIDKLVNNLSISLKCLLSLAVIFSSLSILYYFSLAIHASFYLLLAIMSGINIFHLYRYQSIGVCNAVIKANAPKAGAFFRSKLFFIACSAVLLLSIGFAKLSTRWGGWDAWAIWNLHAKFLFYPDSWAHMFTNKIAFSHPDYPLMIPSLVAFFWRSLGSITPFIPAIICYCILLAVPLVISIALYQQYRSVIAAILPLIILIPDPKFLFIACSQCADTPLALFILLSFIFYRKVGTTNASLLYFVGFIAASATWIKNEGILFYLSFTTTFILFNIRKPRLLVRYFVGSLLPLVALASFKMGYAPANDLIRTNRFEDIKQQLLQVNRYKTIIKALFSVVLSYYLIIPILICVALAYKFYFFRSFSFIALSIVCIGYFFVYVTTPNDLEWHLGSSADRVIHHIYPAMIYLLLSKLIQLIPRKRRAVVLPQKIMEN